MKTLITRLLDGFTGLAVLLVLMGAVVIALLSQSGAVAKETAVVADNQFVTSYPLPGEGAPNYLVQADDQFWFTAPGNNAIGKLEITSTANYTYTFFPLPTASSMPYDLAWDGTHIWFTVSAANKIGKLDVVTGNITEYDIPTANSEPAGITVAADGKIWFVERSGNKLGAFDPATETFTEYLYDQPDAGLEDVAAQPSTRYIWFTAQGLKLLVKFDPSAGDDDRFENWPVNDPFVPGIPSYTPSQVVFDDRGNPPWVSTANGLVGRLAPGTLQHFRWYRVGSENSVIDGLLWIADGFNNKLWFTESNTGYVGQLTTLPGGATLSKWRFPITGEGGSPVGIVTEADGTVWVADSGNHTLLEWSPPYMFSTYLPAAAKPD